MKVLIWIACFFVYGIVDTLINYTGMRLGGVPTIILFAITIWIAKSLCSSWDDRNDTKPYTYQDKNYDEQRFPNGYKCGKCGRKGPYEGVCPDCGSTLKFRIADDEAQKGGLCDKKSETVAEIKISGDSDARDIKVCAECQDKHNETITCGFSSKKNAKSPKIMFCRKCGEKLLDDSEFCGKCGTKIM